MKDRVLRLRIVNDSAKRPYDNQPVPGLPQPDHFADVRWTACDGNFPFVPDVRAIHESELGTITEADRRDDVCINVSARNKGAVQFNSWINVEETGHYVLSFSTPTKGFVRVHEAGVLDADYGYESGATLTATLHLGIGYHPVRVTVLTDDGGKAAYEFECRK